MHGSPFTSGRRRSVWLVAALGPLDPDVKQDSFGAPTNGARVSTDQTTISVITDAVLTFGLKSWSRGQNSQASSCDCSGGVSAVKGSSDLDEHTRQLWSIRQSAVVLIAFCRWRPNVEMVCVELVPFKAGMSCCSATNP